VIAGLSTLIERRNNDHAGVKTCVSDKYWVSKFLPIKSIRGVAMSRPICKWVFVFSLFTALPAPAQTVLVQTKKRISERR
jgi:hypothetical protein